MKKSLKNGCRYYDNLNIPIRNYFEAHDDIRWLLILPDYYELPFCDVEDLSALQQTYNEIKQEYTINDSAQSKDIFIATKLRNGLIGQQHILSYILEVLRHKYNDSVKVDSDRLENCLKEIGFPIKYSNKHEFYDELDEVARKAKNLDHKIKNKEKYINDRCKGKESKDFDYMVLMANIEVGLKIKIDIEKDNMRKFIAYKDNYVRLIQSYESNK